MVFNNDRQVGFHHPNPSLEERHMIHQPDQSRTWRLAVAGIATAAVLLASGCSSSDEAAADDPVIFVENATATDANTETETETDAETAGSGSEEEQALAFADCMRSEGIDFPDPVVNADGSVEFFGGDRGADGFAQDAGFQAAVETCGSLIEGASFLPDEGDFTELEDSFLEVAECFRANGIDVPDPQFGEGGAGGGGPFGADFDPDDPATAAAVEACQDILAGLDGARGGNN